MASFAVLPVGQRDGGATLMWAGPGVASVLLLVAAAGVFGRYAPFVYVLGLFSIFSVACLAFLRLLSAQLDDPGE